MLTFKRLAVAMALCVSQAAFAEPDQCTAVQEKASANAKAITEKYESRIASKSQQYEGEAKKIEDEAPNPSAAGAVLKFDIVTTMKTQEIIMDLPQVTMKNKEMSMDFPEVTMAPQQYSWDEPVGGMNRQCSKVNPRVTCRGFKCTVEWDDVCIDVPTVTMRRKEASMDVPQVTMKTKKVIMGVPEVAMKPSSIKLDLPQITVKNIAVEAQKAADEGQALSERATSDMKSLSDEMKDELAATTAASILDVFACNIDKVEGQKKQVLSEIDGQILTLSASKEEAIKNKATQLVESFDNALTQLTAGRASAEKEFVKAIEQLVASRDATLKKELPGKAIEGQ